MYLVFSWKPFSDKKKWKIKKFIKLTETKNIQKSFISQNKY